MELVKKNIKLKVETKNYGTVTIYLNDEVVYSWNLPYYDSFGKAPAKSIMIYNNELNNMALAEVVGNLCKNYDLDFRKGYKLVFEHE